MYVESREVKGRLVGIVDRCDFYAAFEIGLRVHLLCKIFLAGDIMRYNSKYNTAANYLTQQEAEEQKKSRFTSSSGFHAISWACCSRKIGPKHVRRRVAVEFLAKDTFKYTIPTDTYVASGNDEFEHRGTSVPGAGSVTMSDVTYASCSIYIYAV